MSWLLVGLAAVVVLMACGERKPLQDVPVAKRPWGKVDVLVGQRNAFADGKPGRTEYFFAAAASEKVGRCPEAASDEPSFKAEGLRLTLLPALTGGRCGESSFSSSWIPDDPRFLTVPLPDLEKAPVRVTLVEGGREALLVLSADKGAIRLERRDPGGLLGWAPETLSRLPDRLYVAEGVRGAPELWDGDIKPVPQPPHTLGGRVQQYCRLEGAPEGARGVSDLDPQALFDKLKPAKLIVYYLDGRRIEIPK